MYFVRPVSLNQDFWYNYIYYNVKLKEEMHII